jgi:hypothetical protein
MTEATEWRRTRLYREALLVVQELQGGAKTVREIAETLGKPWERVYRCLRGMAAAGWPVTKRRRGENRRFVEWYLADVETAGEEGGADDRH